ncbi:MAG: GAF domain-containing protein, partial [Pseudomonadota bacterium]
MNEINKSAETEPTRGVDKNAPGSKGAAARRRRSLDILARASLRINEVLETPAIMRALVEAALELTGTAGGTAGMVADGKMVFTEYNRGGEWVAADYSFGPGRGVPGWVMQHKRHYLSNDAQNDPHVIP